MATCSPCFLSPAKSDDWFPYGPIFVPRKPSDGRFSSYFCAHPRNESEFRPFGETTTPGEPGSAGITSAGRRSVARRTPRIPSERARSRCGYIRSDLIGPISDDLQFDQPVGSEGCANAATTTRPSGGKSESAVPRVAMAGEENDYGARASSRTPNRVGALTEANVNEMMAPNSAAKLASFKGRWVIARALRINTPGGFFTAA